MVILISREEHSAFQFKQPKAAYSQYLSLHKKSYAFNLTGQVFLNQRELIKNVGSKNFSSIWKNSFIIYLCYYILS